MYYVDLIYQSQNSSIPEFLNHNHFAASFEKKRQPAMSYRLARKVKSYRK
jgi:hypothetical protein